MATIPAPFYPYNKATARGVALVICNSKYPNGKSLWPSCHMDGDLAEAAYRLLGYEVMRLEDLDRAGILKAFDTVVARAKVEHWDSFCFHFSGHGCRRQITYSYGGRTFTDMDDQMVGIDLQAYVGKKEVLDMFLPVALPQLAGKPKLFVFDCCRGAAGEDVTPDKNKRGLLGDALHIGAIPEYADIILGQASRPFHMCGSEDDNTPGTYSNALYTCMANNFHIPEPQHLAEVMTCSNLFIMDALQHGSMNKESPNFESYLTGKWYIGPGAGPARSFITSSVDPICPCASAAYTQLKVDHKAPWNKKYYVGRVGVDKSGQPFRFTRFSKIDLPVGDPAAHKPFETPKPAVRAPSAEEPRHIAIAEYAPMGGVLIGFPRGVNFTPDPSDPTWKPSYNPQRSFGVPLELIVHLQAQPELHVFILAPVTAAEDKDVRSSLLDCARSLHLPYDDGKVIFLPIDTDSYWTRDFGTWWCMREGNPMPLPVIHTYNRLRPLDIAATTMIPQYLLGLGCDMWELGLFHTGGNMMEGDQGDAASSALVLRENDKISQAQVVSTLQKNYGINNYRIFSDPMDTYIAHIDCWAKFLPNRTVVIDKHPQVPELDRRAEEFQQWGYKVFRLNLYAAGDAANAYSNTLLINNTLYLPLSGIPVYDKNAADVYQQALGAKYQVVGIPGRPDAPWLATDALHCRTRGIPQAVVAQYLAMTKKKKKDEGHH